MTPVMPTREGATLTLFHTDGLDETQKKMLIAGVGVGAAMLLPAVGAARQAAQRNQSMNNQKQIMLALLNHESATSALPAHAIYSADGKPLLSWRVKILPYLEQRALYDQFRLDEPWDSAHNKALIAQMPDVFRHPNLKLEPGKTNYLAIVGKDCLFNGTEKGLTLRQVTDGTSNTVAVVEASPDQAVEWTKPDDLEFNPDDPKAGLGNVHAGGWNAAFCDGHVQFISEYAAPEMLKALFTCAGGEAVQFPAEPIPVAPAGLAPAQEFRLEERGR
jgi:prepilin-type processing-associated H-X9-DG protein